MEQIKNIQVPLSHKIISLDVVSLLTNSQKVLESALQIMHSTFKIIPTNQNMISP